MLVDLPSVIHPAKMTNDRETFHFTTPMLSGSLQSPSRSGSPLVPIFPYSFEAAKHLAVYFQASLEFRSISKSVRLISPMVSPFLKVERIRASILEMINSSFVICWPKFIADISFHPGGSSVRRSSPSTIPVHPLYITILLLPTDRKNHIQTSAIP